MDPARGKKRGIKSKNGRQRRGRFERSREAMQLTERDQEIVHWIYQARLATREQIQRRFFTVGGRNRCQVRLTLLFGNHYIDKLTDVSSNEPDIYYLSRRCTAGLALIRKLHPDEKVVPHLPRSTHLRHFLDIADVRIAVHQACATNGYSLPFWLGEDACSKVVKGHGLLPDAYFQLIRSPHDGTRRSGYFLEVERSAKSRKELIQKITSYKNYYYEGHYDLMETSEGLGALRVLILVGSEYGFDPTSYIAKIVNLCRERQVGILWLTSLQLFLEQKPEDLPFAKIWSYPKVEHPVSLFDNH